MEWTYTPLYWPPFFSCQGWLSLILPAPTFGSFDRKFSSVLSSKKRFSKWLSRAGFEPTLAGIRFQPYWSWFLFSRFTEKRKDGNIRGDKGFFSQSPSGRRQPAATIPRPNERFLSLPHFLAPKTCQPGQGAQRCGPVRKKKHRWWKVKRKCDSFKYFFSNH